MGLDQYAYTVAQGGELDGEEVSISEWRKHNRLHGWMEQLWEDKGRPYQGDLDDFDGNFNCVPVELTLSDIEQLEAEITNMTMPETAGFFFGGDSFFYTDDDGNEFPEGDYYYKERDLEFVKDARKALTEGKKVYYSSWW